MDLLVERLYDAAHLYVTDGKSRRAATMPSAASLPTVASAFEMIADGGV
jgi:hypothetical protein